MASNSFLTFQDTRKGIPSLPKGKKKSIHHFFIVEYLVVDFTIFCGQILGPLCASPYRIFNQEEVYYSLYQIAQIHESTMDNLSTYKEPMTCIFCATPKAPKSCAMQEIWIECSIQYQYTKRTTKEWLSLTLLYHVLLLGAQS